MRIGRSDQGNLPGGTSRRFTRTMAVKPVITSPALGRPVFVGFNEVSGLAWSGERRIVRVQITLDGGRHWRDATLDRDGGDRALLLFRYPWQRDASDAPVRLPSRATDSAGRVQPAHAELIGQQGRNACYHYNAVTGIEVSGEGQVRHAHIDA